MKTEIITPREWRAPLAGFLAYLASIPQPESTRYQRSYHLRRFAAETGLSPRVVTHDDLIGYLGSHGWGKSTVHTARSTFRAFYRWAHLVAKIVDEDPSALLPSGRPEAGRPRPASESAIAAGMEAAASDARVRWMIRLASQMGLRCCEICKVHTGDMRQDLLGDWMLVVRGKGGKTRDVEVPARLALELLALEPGYLFPGRVDGHLSPAYVSKMISRALPDGVTAHMLRHRFGSVAYGADRDLRAVQELLGHSSIATTQIYTAVPAGMRRRAVELAAA